MSSTPDRDERLLSIGQQCSDPHCLLVDFLPFKCQHCAQSFCGDHFKVDAHKCPKYDESKHNRVAPSCPLCNKPVAIPLNQDPNIRMEQHINTECSVMTGKRQTKSAPVCARAKCGKVLFAPIGCKNCNQQFCPQHRFPADHNCASTTTTTTTTSSPAPKPSSQQISEFTNKASAASSATLDAVRRKWAATPMTSSSSSSRPKPAAAATVPSKPSNSPSKDPSSHTTNPFSKTDSYSISASISAPRAATILITDPTPNQPPSPINSNTNVTPTPIIKPAPVIDPMSFVPRPVFASA